MFPRVLARATWPQPRVLRHHGSEGVWAAPAMLSLLLTLAYPLEVDGG
jgi:hypothetical protein